jgi:transcriptional regulator with XRE-family HTH domain
MRDTATFGNEILKARKEAGLTQKQLAALVTKEDGEPISIAYLNDIEHGRRNRPSDHLIEQFAQALELAPEFLYFCANEIPVDLRGREVDQKKFVAAYRKFRASLMGEVAA